MLSRSLRLKAWLHRNQHSPPVTPSDVASPVTSRTVPFGVIMMAVRCCFVHFLSFPRLVSFYIRRSRYYILYIGRYFSSSRDFLLHQVLNDHFRFPAVPLKIVHEIGYMFFFFFRLRFCVRRNVFSPSPPAFASVALPMKLLSSI